MISCVLWLWPTLPTLIESVLRICPHSHSHIRITYVCMYVCTCRWILCERYSGCVWLTGGSIVFAPLTHTGTRRSLRLSLPTACSTARLRVVRVCLLYCLCPLSVSLSVCPFVSRSICLFSSAFWELWVQVWASVCVCVSAGCAVCTAQETSGKWHTAFRCLVPFSV